MSKKKNGDVKRVLAPHPLTYKKFQLYEYLDSEMGTVAGKLPENNFSQSFWSFINKESK